MPERHWVKGQLGGKISIMQLDREESTLSIGDPKAWKTHYKMNQLAPTTPSTGAHENGNITLTNRRGHRSEL